jgi:hypothetical protein
VKKMTLFDRFDRKHVIIGLSFMSAACSFSFGWFIGWVTPRLYPMRVNKAAQENRFRCNGTLKTLTGLPLQFKITGLIIFGDFEATAVLHAAENTNNTRNIAWSWIEFPGTLSSLP